MCGNRSKKKVHIKIAKVVQQLNGEEECTARGVTQNMLEQRMGSEQIETPNRTEGTPRRTQTCTAMEAYTIPKTTIGR